MEWIKSILLAIVIAIFIKTFIFSTTYVLGNSMYPTLHEKDRLICKQNSIIFFGFQIVGEISSIKSTRFKIKIILKRIIGIRGDIVAIIDM